MATITIDNLASSKTYNIIKFVSNGRVIIDYDGLFVFAEVTAQGWQLMADTPNEEDKKILDSVIENNGGFNNTSVSVQKE